MGITGLETAFPVLYTSLVLGGKVSMETLLNALCASPRRIFRLGGGALEEGARADICIIDLGEEYTIDSSCFLSQGHSTPFDGWKVRGRVRLTLKDGRIVYDGRQGLDGQPFGDSRPSGDGQIGRPGSEN